MRRAGLAVCLAATLLAAPACAGDDGGGGEGGAAAIIIAEIGVDMTRFPTAGAPGLVGQVRPRDQGVRRARTRATGPPGTATATSPASSAKPPSAPAAPTPSSATATGASPDDAEEEGHRRGRPVHPGRSSGTCCPTPKPASRPRRRPLRPPRLDPPPSSRNHIRASKPSATTSPSNPPPDTTPAQPVPAPPGAVARLAGSILGLDDSRRTGVRPDSVQAHTRQLRSAVSTSSFGSPPE